VPKRVQRSSRALSGQMGFCWVFYKRQPALIKSRPMRLYARRPTLRWIRGPKADTTNGLDLRLRPSADGLPSGEPRESVDHHYCQKSPRARTEAVIGQPAPRLRERINAWPTRAGHPLASTRQVFLRKKWVAKARWPPIRLATVTGDSVPMPHREMPSRRVRDRIRRSGSRKRGPRQHLGHLGRRTRSDCRLKRLAVPRPPRQRWTTASPERLRAVA